MHIREGGAHTKQRSLPPKRIQPHVCPVAQRNGWLHNGRIRPPCPARRCPAHTPSVSWWHMLDNQMLLAIAQGHNDCHLRGSLCRSGAACGCTGDTACRWAGLLLLAPCEQHGSCRTCLCICAAIALPIAAEAERYCRVRCHGA